MFVLEKFNIAILKSFADQSNYHRVKFTLICIV